MRTSNLIGGTALIILGIIFLGNELDWFHIYFRDIFRFWPLVLIGYGVYLLVRSQQRRPPQSPENPL